MANGNPGSVDDSNLGSFGSDIGYPSSMPSGEASVPRITGDDDFKLIPEGGEYIGPDNTRRRKPYLVDNDASFMKVPEGSHYMGPDGITREKPKYGDIGFTAQTLHDMALTPEAKLNAIKSVYGDRVQTDEAGPYVKDEDGKILRPGVRGFKSAMGTAAAETLPAIGMTVGGLLGGTGGAAAGSVLPGAGTLAGGAAGGTAGAIGGAMAGRQANNVILSLLGIHQPIEEQVGSMGREGALTAGGEVLGRGVGKVVNAIRNSGGQAASAGEKMAGLAPSRISEDLAGTLESFGVTPERARSFMGTTEGAIERAESVTRAGGKVPPSVLAPEAPFLRKLEEFDSAFNHDSSGLGRFGQSARDMYERQGENIATSPQVRAVVKEPLTGATESVSSAKAGQRAVEEARTKMAFEDSDLEQRIAQKRQEALAPFNEAGGPEGMAKAQAGKEAAWQRIYQSNIDAANNLIRTGIDQIRLDTDAAMKDMTNRLGSGDLVDNIANQFRSYNSVIRSRASHYYNLFDEASGGIQVPVNHLQDDAAKFFSEMPDALRGKYPMEIKLLDKLSASEGEEAINMTAGELHHLRSWMRHGIDYDDLTPNMREGAMKLFEGKVNKTLQGVEGSELLNKADAFYRENIPYLNNEMIKTTMRAIKGGTGVDPEVAANIFFKNGRAEDVREARRVLGPNLWNAIEAAHIQSLVNKSKSLDGSIDAKTFAGYVEGDFRKGMLEMGYSSPKASELVNVAKDIQRLDGKLPISANDTDSLATILRKAQSAKAEADIAAKTDPLQAFDDAVKSFDKEAKATRKQAVDQRRQGALGFLFKENMPYRGARAADQILSNEDNIVAAAHYFGQNSPTFNALRQVYVHRFLQREFGSTGNIRAQLSKEIPEEVQQLMFPGVTRGQMVELARNMEFLFGASSISGGDIGGSLAGASRITNPSQHVPGFGRFSKIPGVDFVARIALGKYFATIMEGVSHPEFVHWLAKSLNGPPEARLAARAVVNNRLRSSGWVGAAAGQMMAEPNPEEPTSGGIQ